MESNQYRERIGSPIPVTGPPLMGSTYPSAHLQVPSTMACLYGRGAQCWWGKVTNTCVYPPSKKPQVPLTLINFCATYNLSDDILSRFTNNGFTTLNQLCYISLADLRDMAFK